ncbi:rCG43906 [Rattus norvegicus]|uniref:RCG43906 n=1 Tax=Rattus norvegicus TaxID=10116 RepID=A6J7B5_RAT|nr:rCG43906 [Rattus norvegicus]
MLSINSGYFESPGTINFLLVCQLKDRKERMWVTTRCRS